MNQRYVLTTVKLKDLLSHKVQTQNLLFTFTWNVKRPQNNFVPIFNSKVGVRLIHECDLYSSKYGRLNKESDCHKLTYNRSCKLNTLGQYSVQQISLIHCRTELNLTNVDNMLTS